MWMVIGEMLNFSKFPKMSGFVERLSVPNQQIRIQCKGNRKAQFYGTETTALLRYEDHLLSVITENNTYKVIQANGIHSVVST